MTDDDDLGVLHVDGDRATVTFVRRYDHPIEKVWRAVSEPAHLAAWFPGTIEGELVTGAPLRFVVETGDAFDGHVIACDPPRLLHLAWGPDELRIELEADGDATVLTFSDALEELGKAARDAAGWHECLVRLAADLDGAPPPPDGSIWRAVNPRYVERFGPAATTIGPPEGRAGG